jgi:hypothetical protein
MLLRQYTRGKNGAIFLPYTLIFLTLQRWQTFFNCANFLQIFFDFFVKMPFGVFRCGGRRFLCVSLCSLSLRYTDGGGRFLGLRSDFDTPTAAGILAQTLPASS